MCVPTFCWEHGVTRRTELIQLLAHPYVIQSDRENREKRDSHLPSLFVPHVVPIVGNVPNQSQETGTPSLFPTWMAETNCIGCYLLSSRPQEAELNQDGQKCSPVSRWRQVSQRWLNSLNHKACPLKRFFLIQCLLSFKTLN